MPRYNNMMYGKEGNFSKFQPKDKKYGNKKEL